MTPVAVDVSASTGISISGNSSYRIGRLIVVNVKISTTSSLTAANLVHGLPNPVTSIQSGTSFGSVSLNNKNYTAFLTTGTGGMGVIRTADTIPSGTALALSACYIATT